MFLPLTYRIEFILIFYLIIFLRFFCIFLPFFMSTFFYFQINIFVKMSDSDKALNAFLDSFKGDQEEEEVQEQKDEEVQDQEGGQEPEKNKEEDKDEEVEDLILELSEDKDEPRKSTRMVSSQKVKTFKLKYPFNSMKGAYMYGSTLFTNAFVGKARNIPRPPPGNLEVHTNDEVEIFAGS